MYVHITRSLLTDAENLHTLHPRTRHYDLLRWSDPEPDADAQCRLRTAHGSGVCVCWSTSAPGDGRHRNGPPQRHLSHLWRYCAANAPLICARHQFMRLIGFPVALIRSYGSGGARESGQAAGASPGGSEDLRSPPPPQQAPHVPTHADENHRPQGHQH